jgi:hypothetical protein
MSPALDLAGDLESHTTNADAPLVNRQLADLFTAIYVGPGDPRSPSVIRRHFRPALYQKLSAAILARYAEAFGLPVAQLIAYQKDAA